MDQEPSAVVFSAVRLSSIGKGKRFQKSGRSGRRLLQQLVDQRLIGLLLLRLPSFEAGFSSLGREPDGDELLTRSCVRTAFAGPPTRDERAAAQHRLIREYPRNQSLSSGDKARRPRRSACLVLMMRRVSFHAEPPQGIYHQNIRLLTDRPKPLNRGSIRECVRSSQFKLMVSSNTVAASKRNAVLRNWRWPW